MSEAIRSSQFMIIAMNTDSKEFIAKQKVYNTYTEALYDALKFAQNFQFIKYIVVGVATVVESEYTKTIKTKPVLE